MKTVKQLLSEIKKNYMCYSRVRKYKCRPERSPRQLTHVVRFALGISEHYAKRLGYTTQQVLNALEDKRTSWSPNYYQRGVFPRIGKNVEVFETAQDLRNKFPSGKFRCPACNGISTDPVECNSGLPARTKSGKCDWKAYGLFGTLGKGYSYIIKEEFLKHPMPAHIFMPMELGQ